MHGAEKGISFEFCEMKQKLLAIYRTQGSQQCDGLIGDAKIRWNTKQSAANLSIVELFPWEMTIILGVFATVNRFLGVG